MKYAFIFVILYFIKSCDSTIYAYDDTNATSTFSDSESQFGTTIGGDGMIGILAAVEPIDACRSVKERPYPSIFNNKNISVNAFALISRGGCDFAVKVLNAQKANFNVAIVFNVGSDKLVEMGTLYPDTAKQVSIPSVFIGQTAADVLNASYLYFYENSPMIEIFDDTSPFSLKYYIIPFLIVLSTCFVGLMFFMGVRFIRDRRRTRRNRLSRQRLKQLPTKLFVKGDEYDVCAICLDDYEEGDNLRILPCHHAYHCTCVDPWLTTSKRVCPLCKRRVLSDDESSNNSQSDSESENAPLIASSPASSANAARYGTGFSPRNPFLRDYSNSVASSQTSDEESVPTTRNVQQHQQILQHQQQKLATSSEETPSTSYDPRFTLLIDVDSTDPNTSSANSFSSSSTIESHQRTSSPTDSNSSEPSPDNSPSFYTLSSGSEDGGDEDVLTPSARDSFQLNPVLGESPGTEVVVIVQGDENLDNSSFA